MRKNEIEFEVWHPDLEKTHKVKRAGKLYTVSGVEIAMFPVGVMAEAILRDVKTLRRWEKEGNWPKSQWVVPDGRCKRWYSGRQVLLAYNVHKEFCGGQWGYSHSPHFNLPEFFRRVREMFYRVDSDAVKERP